MWLPQKMCPHVFFEPPTSSLVPPWGWHLWLQVKHLCNCEMWHRLTVNLRVNSKNSGNHLIFHSAPSSGQNINFPNMLVEDYRERRTLWPSRLSIWFVCDDGAVRWAGVWLYEGLHSFFFISCATFPENRNLAFIQWLWRKQRRQTSQGQAECQTARTWATAPHAEEWRQV